MHSARQPLIRGAHMPTQRDIERELSRAMLELQRSENFCVYYKDGLWRCDRRSPNRNFEVTHLGTGATREEAVQNCCRHIVQDGSPDLVPAERRRALRYRFNNPIDGACYLAGVGQMPATLVDLSTSGMRITMIPSPQQLDEIAAALETHAVRALFALGSHLVKFLVKCQYHRLRDDGAIVVAGQYARDPHLDPTVLARLLVEGAVTIHHLSKARVPMCQEQAA